MGHPIAIFLSTPDPNFRCGICLDIFDDPVSLLRCGHTYCRSCLDSSLNQTGRRCPECRAEIDLEDDDDDDDDDAVCGGNGNVIHPVRVIRSAIDNSLVRCGNNNDIDIDDMREGRNGASYDDDCARCDWTGPLSSFQLHALTNCPISKIRCPIPGCRHECPRSRMKHHVGSPGCVKAAVVSQVEERMDGFLSDLREQMRREVHRRVSALNEEKEGLEMRLSLESDRRLALQRENSMLMQENYGLEREIGELRRTVRDLIEEDHYRRLLGGNNRGDVVKKEEEVANNEEEEENEEEHTTTIDMHTAEANDPESRGDECIERKRRRRDHAVHGASSSVSPSRSSEDGDADTSTTTTTAVTARDETTNAKRKRRRRKNKRREMRRQRREEIDELRGRIRAISSENFD